MASEPVKRRVARHRQKQRAAGLRPVQLWVPDTRRKGFAVLARKQSRLLWNDAHEQRTLKWLAAVADTKDWK